MNKINKNFEIGSQALSVLCFLPDDFPFANDDDFILSSTRPWYNGRERGVVISLQNKKATKWLHIAWFEHRNGDSICSLKWETQSDYWNHPLEDKNIFDIAYGGTNKTKYDYAFSVKCGEIGKMADWIIKEFELFYK